MVKQGEHMDFALFLRVKNHNIIIGIVEGHIKPWKLRVDIEL
jgi:hypothetical protein